VAVGRDATTRRSGLGMVTYYRDANELMWVELLDCYGIMTVNITFKFRSNNAEARELAMMCIISSKWCHHFLFADA